MNFNNFSGHAYLLIGGLVLIGAGLMLVSLVVNRHVAKSALEDERHREKIYEYYRNTLAQLGIILIGIGISLFTFFFQQNYRDARDRESELQRVLGRIAVRVGRAAPVMEALAEFDPILDEGAPYSSESYGSNQPISASGPELARKVKEVQAAMRDVDLQQFEVTTLSRDIDESFLIGELDPRLWFDVARDESYTKYAVAQLTLDYQDLRNGIGSEPIERAVANPDKEAAIKSELRDIFYDMDLLRDRARRAVGRACWFVSSGPQFVELKPLDALEADYKTHDEWLGQAQRAYAQFGAGRENCFTLLHARPNGELQNVRSEATMPKLKAR
ncbi:MAG: hypothetical protein ACJ8AS_12520 [Hyphomicrobiales bacterium]